MAEDKISQRVSLFTNTLKTSYPQIYGGLTEQDFSAKIKSDPAFQQESYAALRALNKFSNLPESGGDYLKLFSSDVAAPKATTAQPVETEQPVVEEPVQTEQPVVEEPVQTQGNSQPVGVLAPKSDLTDRTREQILTPMAVPQGPNFQQWQNQAEINQAAKSPVFLANKAANAVLADREQMAEANPLTWRQDEKTGKFGVFEKDAPIESKPLATFDTKNQAAAAIKTRGAASDGLIFPTKEAEQEFQKLSPEQQQVTLEGSTGAQFEQNKKDSERTFAQKWGIGGDVDMSMWEGFKQIAKNTLAGAENYLAQGDRATIEALKKARQQVKEGKKPDLGQAYIDVNQERQQRLYNKATEIEKDFQNRIGDLNIETSVYQQLKKGNFARLPEATAYTVANSAMQIIPALFTYGGSSYLQTIPNSYKSGVDAIAQAKGVTPEEVIKSGDDAQLVAQISAVTQAALDYFGAGMISKSISTKGGYAAVRDWLIKKGLGKNFARGLGLTYAGAGEGFTEALQEGVAITGEIGSPKNSVREFISKFPKEFWTPENRERIYDSAVAGFIGGVGADAAGSTLRKATSPPSSLGGIPTRPVSQPVQGQPIAPSPPPPAPASGPAPTNQSAPPPPTPPAAPVEPTGPTGQPLTDDEIEGLSPGQKWKRFSGPDAGLSDIVGESPIQVLHNGNGITYTAEKTGEEVDGVPIFNITSPDGKTTKVEGDVTRFQALPKNEAENIATSESENQPVTGAADGVVRGNDVVSTTGNPGEFSPEQKSDIRNSIPFTAAGWARRYFLEGGQVNTQSASKEVTGLRNGKSSKDVINGIIGHHSNKPDAPNVERIAEILRTRANEEGIELDEQDLRDAVIQAIGNGKKSWMADQAKEVLPQSQWEPEGFELDYYFPKQEFPETPVHKFPGLNDAESKKLTDFVRERIPGGISKDGVIALSKLQGIAQEAAMNEVLGPDLTQKVQGLPVDTVQEIVGGKPVEPAQQSGVDAAAEVGLTKEAVTEKLGINHPFYQKVSDALAKLGLIEKYNPETQTGDVIGGYVQGIVGGGFSSGKFIFNKNGDITYLDNGVKVQFDQDGNVISENIAEAKQEAAKVEIESRKSAIENLKKIRDSEDFKYKTTTRTDEFTGEKKTSKRLKTAEELKESTDKINAAISKAENELAALQSTQPNAEPVPTPLPSSPADVQVSDDLQTQKPIVAGNAVTENKESEKPEKSSQTDLVLPPTNNGSADAQFFGDSTKAEAIRTKGFESLDGADKLMVLGKVKTLINDKEVLKSIIKTIPVDVMDMLIGQQWTSDMLLHDPSMLTHRLTISGDVSVFKSVAGFINALASKTIPVSTSDGTKKLGLAPSGSQLLSDDNSTSSAGNSPSNHVIISVDDQITSVNINPTEAQKQAGNYKLGAVNIQGLDISIENPEGSERKGVDSDGKPWSVKMKNHYGYIRGTEGADGDHVDVFIGPNPESQKVFVVDQVNEDGSFDEHKVVLATDTEEAARKAYLSNYSKGWTGLGAITEMSMDDFKEWLKTEDPKKPVGDISARESKENPLEALQKQYEETPLDDLVKLKKELYSDTDLESPKSPEEKLLEKVIADKFSEKNQEIINKRKEAKERQNTEKQEKREERDTELDAQKKAVLERMRKRQGGTLKSGIDPEDLADALEFIGLAVKGGAYKVSDVVNDAAELLGEISAEMIRAIKAGYNAYRGDENTPDEISDQMDDEKTVRKFQFQKQDDDGNQSEANGAGQGNGGAGNTTTSNNAGGEGTRNSGQQQSAGGTPNSGGTSTSGTTATGGTGSSTPSGSGSGGPIGLGTPRLGGLNDANQQHNFRYPDNFGESKGKTFSKTKAYKENIEALQTILQLISEPGVFASDAQKEILSKYNGFGPLSEILFGNDEKQKVAESNQKYWDDSRTVRDLISEIARASGKREKQIMEEAKSSALTAFYTPLPLIRGMWAALQSAKFDGGRVLEGSVGNGRFIGGTPGDLMTGINFRGIDKDFLSSQVAKYLYPNASITNSGLEKASVAPNGFDVFISNIPFGNIPIYDAAMKQKGGLWEKSMNRIHGYFVAKALSSVRPGGYVAIVSTSNLLDTPGNADIRELMEQEADFVGAVRLPASTFDKDAGTKVTTDVFFLRKKQTPGKPENPQIQNVIQQEMISGKSGEKMTANINEYFQRNPQNVFGEYVGGGLYSAEDGYSLRGEFDPEAVQKRMEAMTQAMPMEAVKIDDSNAREILSIDPSWGRVVPGGLVSRRGAISRVLEIADGNVVLEPVKDTMLPSKADLPKALQFLALKKAYYEVLTKDFAGEDATKERGILKKQLQDFEISIRPQNLLTFVSSGNKLARLLQSDPDFFSVTTLRKDDGSLADILTSPMQQKPVISKTDNIQEAIIVSMNQKGRLDIPYIQTLMGGKTRAETVAELGDYIFETPDGEAILADKYLSGNVKLKLAEAKKWAKTDPKFKRNVTYLEDVQPEDLPMSQIKVQLGQNWIPREVYQDFFNSVFGENQVTMLYNAVLDQYDFRIGNGAASNPKYVPVSDELGRNNVRSVEDVLEIAFTKSPKSYTVKIDDDTFGLPLLSEDARSKAELLESEFKSFVLTDSKTANTTSTAYNEKFNTTIRRTFDGSFLTFPGSSGFYGLRQHQLDAIYMLAENMGGIIDHIVGAGKSLVLGAGAIKLKQMGLIKKPVIASLKAATKGVQAQILQQYPTAKVLAVKDTDFEPAKREAFFAKIANNDWDVIVMTHEQMAKIPLPAEFEQQYIENEIMELEAAMEDLSDDRIGGRQKKDLQNKIEKLQADLSKVQDRGNKGSTIDWGQMGLDFLMVDESQQYKNLSFITKKNRVSGLGNAKGSTRARRLKMNCRYLQNLHGGDKGVVFASGTPISNSLTEVYNIFQYLRPSLLKDLGISSLDQFLNNFTDISTEFENSVSNTFQSKTRVRTFGNVPELASFYTEIADVRDDSNLKLPKPGIKGGKGRLEVVQSGRYGKMINDAIMEAAKRKSAAPLLALVGEGAHISPKVADALFLNLATLNAKAALDPRLIFPGIPEEEGKIRTSSEKIMEIYRQTQNDKGVQLVFSDLGTPKDATAKIGKRVEDAVEARVGKDFIGEYSNADKVWASKTDEEARAKLAEVFEFTEDEINDIMEDANDVNSFSVYQALKDRLVESGMPENEIAFIQDPKNEKQREELFAKVRKGEIRVLIGGTQKLGTGVNVQNRIAAIHHLDIPWRPSDIEQRNGRGIRQGNMFNEVEIIYYGTEGTLDSYKFDLLGTKGAGINGFRQGSKGQREIEFDDGESMSPTEFAARLSGDDRLLRKVKAEGKIRQLSVQIDSVFKSNKLLADRRGRAQREMQSAREKRDEAVEIAATLKTASEAARKIYDATPSGKEKVSASVPINIMGADYVLTTDKEVNNPIITRLLQELTSIRPPSTTYDSSQKQLATINGVPVIGTKVISSLAGDRGQASYSYGLKIGPFQAIKSAGSPNVTSLNSIIMRTLAQLDSEIEKFQETYAQAVKNNSELQAAKELEPNQEAVLQIEEARAELQEIEASLKRDEEAARQQAAAEQQQNNEEDDDVETNIGKPQKNSPEQRQKLVQSTLAVFSRLGSLTGSTMDIITDPNEIDRIKAAQRIGQIMRAGDEVLGFVHNGKVYVDPRVANEKTPIHEAGHVWLNFMEQNNPTFFDHGIRLIKEQPAYIKEAKRILLTNADSMPVYKEALALAIADEGARAQRIAGTDKVKNFLRSMYEKIGRAFRINRTPDEISKMSFEEFTRSAAYWLTSGDPDILDAQDPIMKQFLANQEKRILDQRSWLKKAISTLSNAMVAVSGLWRSMPYLRGVGFGEIKNILGQMKRVMGAAMVGAKAQVEAIYSGMTKDEADILGLYTNLLAIREEIAEGIHDDIPGDTEISFGITKDNIGQAVVDYAEKLDQNPAIRAAFETRKQIFKDLYQRGVDVGMYSADKGWEYYYRRIRQDAIQSKYTNTLSDLLRNAWRGRGGSTISTKKATTSVFKSREVFRGDFYTNSKEVDMDALVLMNIGIGIREKINRIKQVYQKDVLDAYLESQKVGTEVFKLETGRTRQTAIQRIKKSIQPAINSFFSSPIPPVDDRTDDIEMADMEVQAKLRAQKTSREWAKSFLATMGSNAVEFGPREKAIYGNLQQEVYHKLYKAYRVIALNKISDPDVIQGISNAIKGLPTREFRKHYNKQVYARFLGAMEEKGFAAFYPEGFARQMGNRLLNNMAFDAGSQDVQEVIQRFNVDVEQAMAAYKTAATKDGAEVMWAPKEVVDTLNDMAPVTKNQMMENIKQGIRGFISKYKVFQLINPLNVVNYLFTNLTGNSIRYAEVGGNLAYLKKAIESLESISAEERAQLMELNVLNSGDLTQDYTIGMTGFKTASGEQFTKMMSDVKSAILKSKSLSDAKDVFAEYLKERGASSVVGDATDSYVGMARAMDNIFTDIYRYATYLKAIDQIRNGYTPNLGANLYDMMDIGTEEERAAYGASKAFGDYASASRYMSAAADYGILPYVRYMNTMVMQFYGQRLLNILRRATMDLNAGKSKADVAAKFTTETGSVVLGMTAVYIAGQLISNMLIDDEDEEKRMLTDTGGDGIAFGKDPEGNNRQIRLGAPGQDFMRMLGIISAYNHYLSGAESKLDDKVLDDMGAEIYGMVGPMVKVPLSAATGKNKMYDFGSEAPVTNNFDLLVRALPGNAVSRAGFNQIGALFGEDVEPTPDGSELVLGATPVKKTAYAMEIQGKVRELLEVTNLTKPLPTKAGTEEQQDFYTAQRNAYKTLLLGKADEFMPRFDKYVEKGGDIKTLEKFIERKNPLSRISKKNQAALYEFAFGGDGVIELAHTTPMMASEVFTEEDRKLIRLSLETWKEQDEKVYNTFVEAISK